MTLTLIPTLTITLTLTPTRHDCIVSTAHAGGPAVSLWRYSLLQVKTTDSIADLVVCESCSA